MFQEVKSAYSLSTSPFVYGQDTGCKTNIERILIADTFMILAGSTFVGGGDSHGLGSTCGSDTGSDTTKQ